MKIVSNIKCFVKKSIHKIKRMNKSKKLTALSIFTLLIILGLFMLFNNKTLTEFVSKIINRTETLEYVPLDVTSAQIYTTENELLKSYKQKDMSDEIINDVKISLGFNVKMESLYKDGKWIGQAIYNLPENIKANADNYTGIVYCNGEQVGTFLANANNIILTFDENQMTIGTIIYGNFSFWGSVSFKDLEYSSTYHVKFSEDAYYDVDIELVTSLKLYKKALEPVIDKENSTVTFNYEVRVFSPASTNNEQIEFEDVLTEISSPEENITRPNIKVEWKDYEGNTKEIPNNTKIFKDGKKRIFGTLPPMESGDSIIISYSVIEQSDSFTYKQFNESNKAKVKMQVEGSNPIELEVSTKSAAVTFIGEEWYDINVKKALASSIKNVEENYFKYSYNIEINSTLGTKNHNIDFKDSLSINAQLNNNEITIENFRIYRVIDDYEQDITSNNYISLTENVNTETIPIECDIATGKLPPLKEGEKYVIKYDLKITNAEALEFYIDNKAEVKVGKLSTEDALATDSVPIDDDILLESSYSRREVEKYPTCGNTCSFYTINYKTTTDFIFNINSDNKTLRNDYTIEYTGYRKTFDQEEWIVELYDVNSLDSYETISLSLPLKFVRKGEKFYIFDSTGKKVEMHSRRDSLIIKNSLTTSDTYSVMVGLALKSGDNVLKSESSYAYVGGKKSCSPRNCNNEGSPYCNYIDKDDEVLKEFISVNKDEEKNVALFNWKTKIIPLNKYEFGGINYYDYLESDYEDFKAHYYTLEQIKNIKVYGLKNDGTQKDFNLDTDYKISAVLCDDINCSSTYYRDINVLTDEKYYTKIKITFNSKRLDESYDYIIYETQSTSDIEFENSSSFLTSVSNSLYNEAFSLSSNCHGFSRANYVYENFPDQASDVLQKYNFNQDGTSTKKANYSYLKDVDEDNHYLYYRVVINKDGTLNGDITYTDILPRGTTLDTNYWEFGGKECSSYPANCNDGILLQFANIGDEKDENWASNSSYYKVDYSYDEATRKLEITIPETIYKRLDYKNPSLLTLGLYYRVRIIDKVEDNDEFVNSGTLVTSNANKSDTATARILTQKFYKKFDGFIERDKILKYHVTINENGYTMLDGNPLTLVDTMSYANSKDIIKGVSVDKIRLYELVDGEKGPKIAELDYSTKDIENGLEIYMEIPDSKPLYLEYSYKIDLFNNYPNVFKISNDIAIVGQTEGWAKVNSTDNSLITGIEADAFTNSTELSLTKTDINNFDKVLEGATYKLDKYNGSKWLNLGAFTTGKDGSISIGEPSNSGKLIMLYNHAYRVKEVEAPKGYAIDPKYRYIYLANPNLKEEFIPEGFDKENVINKNLGFARVSDEILVLSAEDNPNTRSGNIIAIIVIMVLSSIFMIFAIKKKKEL